MMQGGLNLPTCLGVEGEETVAVYLLEEHEEELTSGTGRYLQKPAPACQSVCVS